MIKSVGGRTLLVKPERAIMNLTSVTSSAYAPERTLSFLPFIRNGSLKGEWYFRGIALPIKIGKLQFSKIWDHALPRWKRRRQRTFMVSSLVTRLKLPMLFMQAYIQVELSGTPCWICAFLPRHVQPPGRASKSMLCHCCVHFTGILIAGPCGKYIVTNMSKS